jgi:hypothetical protein
MGRLEYYVVKEEIPLSSQAVKLDRRTLAPAAPLERALKGFTPRVDLAKVSWTVHRSPFERGRSLRS